jgi:FtsP/CotA-like multicopper oxidase with cupredoxin domain
MALGRDGPRIFVPSTVPAVQRWEQVMYGMEYHGFHVHDHSLAAQCGSQPETVTHTLAGGSQRAVPRFLNHW